MATSSCAQRLVILAVLLSGSPASGQTLTQLSERGIQLQLAGRYREALAAYEAALRAGTPSDPNYEVVLTNLSTMYLHFDQTDKAEAILKAVLARQETRLGAEAQLVGSTLENLGSVYFSQGRYDEALPTFMRALEITNRFEPLESIHMVRLLGWLNASSSVLKRGGGDAMRGVYTRILHQLEARIGTQDPRLAVVLMSLENIAAQQHRYHDAEQLIDRVQGLPVQTDKRYPVMTGATLATMRLELYLLMGRYAEALEQQQYIIQAQQAKTERGNQWHKLLYASWAGEGDILLELGQVEQAAKVLEAALKGAQRTNAPHLCATACSLAHAYERLGKVDQAEALYRQVMAIKKQSRADSVYAGVHLSKLLIPRGETAEAEHLLLDAIEHYRKYQVLGGPYCAQVRRLLGELYLRTGRLAESESEFRTAIDLQQKLEGRRYAELSGDYLGLSQVLAKQGKTAEALDAADESRHVLHELTVKMLPAMPEAEQLNFLANQENPALEQALALVRDQTGNPAAIEHSAAWLLNQKGLAQQAIGQRMRLAHASDDPALLALANDWMAASHQLAKLSTGSLDGTDVTGKTASTEQDIAALAARERELSRQLGRVNLRLASSTPWYKLDQLRAALPDSAVYVELTAYTPPTGSATPVYLAWLVPPADKGTVRLVELGSAAEIDAAIEELRRQLALTPQAGQLKGLEVAGDSQPGNKSDEPQLAAALRQVSQRLLGPMLPVLSDYEHWVICPDAALWLVPWCALPLPAAADAQPRYAIEDHRVSFVISGRDLIDTPAPVSGNPSLVLADPDFDADPASTLPVDRVAHTPWFGRDLATRSAGDAHAHWSRLPGTAEEAEHVAPALAAYTHAKPEILLGRHASAETLKEAWRPRIALLSTHGFWLEPSPAADGRLGNPLLGCGLALAGANLAEHSDRAHRDVGIVTGMDILSMDLLGTELVILSACETGLGQLHAGEGVAGLRQAFQLAGARAVMATLWRIPDADTAQLMSLFFKHLAAGSDKATALAQAQRELLANRRKAGKSPQPYLWAAFTLTGDWRTAQVGPATPRPEPPQRLDLVEVVVEAARVMDGPTMLAELPRGQRLPSGQRNDPWIQVFYEPGSRRSGWILQSQVRPVK